MPGTVEKKKKWEIWKKSGHRWHFPRLFLKTNNWQIIGEQSYVGDNWGLISIRDCCPQWCNFGQAGWWQEGTPSDSSSSSPWRIPSLLPGKCRYNPWIVQKWRSPLGSHKLLLLLWLTSPLPFLSVWYPLGSKSSSEPPVLLPGPADFPITEPESSDQAQSERAGCSIANFMLKINKYSSSPYLG